jgi:hypothetical protein
MSDRETMLPGGCWLENATTESIRSKKLKVSSGSEATKFQLKVGSVP